MWVVVWGLLTTSVNEREQCVVIAGGYDGRSTQSHRRYSGGKVALRAAAFASEVHAYAETASSVVKQYLCISTRSL